MELEKLEHLRQEYGWDKKEFGKVLFIASASLLVVSAHAALTLQSVADNVEESNDQLERTSGILNSDSFQQAVDQLQKIQSQRISTQINVALDSFQQAEKSIEQSQKMEKELKSTAATYQWISLIGIIGMVSGIAVIYS